MQQATCSKKQERQTNLAVLVADFFFPEDFECKKKKKRRGPFFLHFTSENSFFWGWNEGSFRPPKDEFSEVKWEKRALSFVFAFEILREEKISATQNLGQGRMPQDRRTRDPNPATKPSLPTPKYRSKSGASSWVQGAACCLLCWSRVLDAGRSD